MSTSSRSSGRERRSQSVILARQVATEPRHAGLGGHHAALAVGHADLVQHVRQGLAEGGVPGIDGSVGLGSVGVDERVVLIHGEQAFAAADRAQHDDAERPGGRPLSPCCEAGHREFRHAAREARDLARDHRRHGGGGEAFGEQRLGDERQARPGPAERGHIRRLIDRVAEVDRGLGA
jgi:hypothetical protein